MIYFTTKSHWGLKSSSDILVGFQILTVFASLIRKRMPRIVPLKFSIYLSINSNTRLTKIKSKLVLDNFLRCVIFDDMTAYQLCFDFRLPEQQKQENFTTQRTELATPSDDTDYIWYRVNKFWDTLFDKIPYGWRIHSKFCDARTNIKATYQRLRYGVCDRDCWCLPHTFSVYILRHLKHFKKMNRYGVPSRLCGDMDNIQGLMDSDYTELGSKRWEQILDEIIWAFEYMCDEDKFNPMPDELLCTNRKPGQDICNWINRKKSDREKMLWNNYFHKSEELNKRKQKGLLLFAEYYDDLWD